MIAIYRQCHDSDSYACRAELLSAGMPCFLIGPGCGCADVTGRVPFVLFPDVNIALSDSFRQKIPKENVLCDSTMLSPSRIVQTMKLHYFQRYREDFESAAGGGIRFSDREVYFRGNLLTLTESEYRIVRLLFHSRGVYFSSEEIAAACFEAEHGAAVGHICNINRKTRFFMDMPLIETRRFYGYRIK